jgi:hypothetical protein
VKRLALAALLPLAAAPAQAVDEIQVYTGEIAAPCEWSLLQHLNYGLGRGLTPASDRCAVKTIFGFSF